MTHRDYRVANGRLIPRAGLHPAHLPIGRTLHSRRMGMGHNIAFGFLRNDNARPVLRKSGQSISMRHRMIRQRLPHRIK